MNFSRPCKTDILNISDLARLIYRISQTLQGQFIEYFRSCKADILNISDVAEKILKTHFNIFRSCLTAKPKKKYFQTMEVFPFEK